MWFIAIWIDLYLTQAVAYDDAKAGIADAVQSFGDFQNFHPHLHVLATNGCFYNDAGFVVCPPPESFILYDESSLPNVDDYLIDANYPMETSL